MLFLDVSVQTEDQIVTDSNPFLHTKSTQEIGLVDIISKLECPQDSTPDNSSPTSNLAERVKFYQLIKRSIEETGAAKLEKSDLLFFNKDQRKNPVL